MEYIPVIKEAIPYKASFRIAGNTYEFTFHYNGFGDFFTIDLEYNGDVLVRGEKITYNRALFVSVLDERFPDIPIVPFDMAAESKRVGWHDLNEEVFLYLFDPGELPDE